jgi:hypothetical protein
LGLCVFPGPDLKPQRTFETYRRRASALALESHQTHVYGSEKMRSGDRSASLKPTDMLLVPQSFHRRSLALCLWLRRSALRRPERTAQAHKHSGEARSGGRSAPLKLTNIAEKRAPEAGARRSSSQTYASVATDKALFETIDVCLMGLQGQG